MKMTAKMRKAMNKKLYAMGTEYYTKIPLQHIFDILEENDFIVVQEDGAPFSGILCGDESRTTFKLQCKGEYVDNAELYLSWYKMQSGRYEINPYIT